MTFILNKAQTYISSKTLHEKVYIYTASYKNESGKL